MNLHLPVVGSLSWLAFHEFNLSWRDFLRMMSAGKRGRERAVLAFMAIAALVIHGIAYLVLNPVIQSGIVVDKALLTIISSSIILTISLMMSQAMELITRVFYSRSDLDLILSSPISPQKLFTVRISAIAMTTTILSLFMLAPAINVLAVFHSPFWLCSYLMIIAAGAVATALSLVVTLTLFDRLGAKTTRYASQIIAAVVGAVFVIGIQLAAISSIGSISRFEFLTSSAITEKMPDISSILWIPAHAAIGDPADLLTVLIFAFSLLAVSISISASGFGERVALASGMAKTKNDRNSSFIRFKPGTSPAMLRQKEWQLLLRDPWLISQSLMQILYLIPPAFMLWNGFGSAGAITVVVIPVIVMASGQLAGGLAWLVISGEDAPQLVESAPIAKSTIIRAKIEAVFVTITFITAPIIFLLVWYDALKALLAIAGISVATVSATMIQLWFRSQAKRSDFRRRQTASKIATVAEAFSSILWAGTVGLMAAGAPVLAVIAGVFAVAVLWIVRSLRPREAF